MNLELKLIGERRFDIIVASFNLLGTKDEITEDVRKIALHLSKSEDLETFKCEFLYQELAIPLSASQKLDIRNSYNGSIDTFFEFWAWYSNKKLKEWTAGGKNDWLDIHHTVYLSNDSTTKFITSDKLLVDGLNAISAWQSIRHWFCPLALTPA